MSGGGKQARFCFSDFESALDPFLKAPHQAIPEWDDYFCAIAVAVALRSKDKKRKVGAVLVGAGRVILSTGFNWLPRGIRELPERTGRQKEKYRWVTHAETNAIFNAARAGISLVDATIYVTTFPCTSCAQAIVQAGIRRVFTHGEYWQKDPAGYEKSIEILAEAGIVIDAPEMRKKDSDARKKAKLLKESIPPPPTQKRTSGSRAATRAPAARSPGRRATALGDSYRTSKRASPKR